MKKFLFGLAFMLVGSVGFAKAEHHVVDDVIKKNLGTCEYSITTTVTTADGDTYSYDTPYTVEASSISNCIEKMNNHVSWLNFLEEIRKPK
jgi:hypothetical protein